MNPILQIRILLEPRFFLYIASKRKAWKYSFFSSFSPASLTMVLKQEEEEEELNYWREKICGIVNSSVKIRVK